MRAAINMDDVTTENTQEEHFLQSHKLASIETMAGGVAHGFNNILTVIISACSLPKLYAVDNPEQMKFVTQINNSAEQAARQTRNLLAFSRRQKISKQSEDLGYMVKISRTFLESHGVSFLAHEHITRN